MSGLVMVDRDGTLNVEKHYLSEEEKVELLPGAAEGIQRLRMLGLPVVVVTNQSGIARGYFDVAALEGVHRRIEELLRHEGTSVDRFYVCPHGPDDECACRKPRPAMALRAAVDFKADLSKSFVIGDKASDIELGKAVGARAILVRTGYGNEVPESLAALADYRVANLAAAAELVETLVVGHCQTRPEA